jgi:hypothetical protein
VLLCVDTAESAQTPIGTCLSSTIRTSRLLGLRRRDFVRLGHVRGMHEPYDARLRPRTASTGPFGSNSSRAACGRTAVGAILSCRTCRSRMRYSSRKQSYGSIARPARLRERRLARTGRSGVVIRLVPMDLEQVVAAANFATCAGYAADDIFGGPQSPRGKGGPHSRKGEVGWPRAE